MRVQWVIAQEVRWCTNWGLHDGVPGFVPSGNISVEPVERLGAGGMDFFSGYPLRNEEFSSGRFAKSLGLEDDGHWPGLE